MTDANEQACVTEGEGTNIPRNTDGVRMFGDYMNPTVQRYGSTIVRTPLAVNNFELNASTIQLVQANAQFGGLPSKNSNQHLTNFMECCGTIKISGVSADEIKRRLFLFSLRDQARI